MNCLVLMGRTKPNIFENAIMFFCCNNVRIFSLDGFRKSKTIRARIRNLIFDASSFRK